MLLSTIIPLYALALVQATALQVNVSPRNIDRDCILEPNSTTTWYRNDGLAKTVRWSTDTGCVNSTMPNSGTINLFMADLFGLGGDPFNGPGLIFPGTTLARNVHLSSGLTTVPLAEDTTTAPFILSLDWSFTNEDGTISNGSHLSQVFLIAEE